MLLLTRVEVETCNLHLLFVLSAFCTNQKDCVAAAVMGGHAGGGKGYTFASLTHPVKGCYSYLTGPFQGHVYYGTGGTINQRKTQLQPPFFRVKSAMWCGGSNNPGGSNPG